MNINRSRIRLTLILTALFVAVVPAVASAAPLFDAKTDFATGTSPRSVTKADFNGDGDPDLAVANQSANTVSVLLGDGTGSFGAKTDFTTGFVPSSVTTADFNSDDKPDLAVANINSDTVSVLLGDGTGSFGAKTDFTTGTSPVSVSTADFNADNKPDLAVTNSDSSSVSVLLGDGTGSFGAKTDFTTGTGPYSVTTGDFNGDNKPDLAVANSGSDNVSVLLGDGAGSFGAKTDFPTGTGPASVSTADFNADNKPDLAVANINPDTVSVLLGDGTGSFGAKTDFTTGRDPFSVTSDDFNGDGDPDLAVANQSANTVSVLLGDGTGSFGAKTDFTTGFVPSSVTTADFNSDDKPDLAVANSDSSSVSVLLGNGTGKLLQKPGAAGCVAEDNTLFDVTACTDGLALSSASSIVVSPDGKNAYAASLRAVAVFDRDPATGELTQKSGLDACTASTNDPKVATCRLGGGLDDGLGTNANGWLAVSPDNRNVYLASGDGIATFSRNLTTGALTQAGDASECVTEEGKGGHPVYRAGECEDGRALDGVTSIAVSPDGKSLYATSDGYDVAGNDGGALAIFDRSEANGKLTQKPGAAGCVVYDNLYAAYAGCAAGRAMRGASSVAISPDPDGKSLYVSSNPYSPDGLGRDHGVAVFDRSSTGQVSQKAGAAGCLVEDNTLIVVGSCADGRALAGASSIAISPEDLGRSLYVGSSRGPGSLAILDRSTQTGELTQKAGTAGCVADSSSFGCADARAIGFSNSPVVSPDGKSLYLDAYDPGILTFDRDTSGSIGALTQKAGPKGCVTRDGTDRSPDFTPGACADGSGLFGTRGLALSPDGLNLYSAAELDSSVGVFEREPAREPADAVPPETTITSGPSGDTEESSPSFAFASSEQGSSFECRLDSSSFAPCSSPKSYTGLTQGDHTFSVRAIDRNRNVDPSPATRNFFVGKAKIGKVTVKAKKKVKKGKKATYKVKIKNSGNIDATGVKVKIKGKGVKAKKNVGTIAAGKAKTVKVKLKFKKPGKVKTSFKVTSGNAGGKTAKKKITVKK